MRKFLLRNITLMGAVAFLSPLTMSAQKDEKGEKGEKDKQDVQQILITRKGEKNDKVVVEIIGDKITVNGKPLEEYQGKMRNINHNQSHGYPAIAPVMA